MQIRYDFIRAESVTVQVVNEKIRIVHRVKRSDDLLTRNQPTSKTRIELVAFLAFNTATVAGIEVITVWFHKKYVKPYCLNCVYL